MYKTCDPRDPGCQMKNDLYVNIVRLSVIISAKYVSFQFVESRIFNLK